MTAERDSGQPLPQEYTALYGHSIFDAAANNVVSGIKIGVNRLQNLGGERFRMVRGMAGYALIFVPVYLASGLGMRQWDEMQAPAREAEWAAYNSEQEAKRLAVEAKYAETVGANILRAEDGTRYYVTPTELAGLSGSRIEWLEDVRGKIEGQSGCVVNGTSYIPPVDNSIFNGVVGSKKLVGPETFVMTIDCTAKQ